MIKESLFIIFFIVTASLARSQANPTDTIRPVMDDVALDSTANYDDLLNDLDLFLDSILAPRSYALLSVSTGQSYFNFVRKVDTNSTLLRRTIWSPVFGYYDKSGLGITLSSYMIRDSVRSEWYQYSVTPSYDYIKNRDLATGISYTRYFTKTQLHFYTTPIQNELNAYFLWRKSWLQPGIMVNYGWGSRTEFIKREAQYTDVAASNLANYKEKPRPVAVTPPSVITIIQRNRESIEDFSLAASVRHDFYWLTIFSKKDYIRFSPLVSLSGGTQKFGFNQTTASRLVLNLNNTKDLTLQEKFRILSSTLYLRAEYSIGKFFVQPQLLFDYYFPGNTDKLTTAFSVNTGFMF